MISQATAPATTDEINCFLCLINMPGLKSDKMDEHNSTSKPWTNVSFRVTGPSLNPELVTEGLGLVPDHQHKKGELRDLAYYCIISPIFASLAKTIRSISIVAFLSLVDLSCRSISLQGWHRLAQGLACPSIVEIDFTSFGAIVTSKIAVDRVQI